MKTELIGGTIGTGISAIGTAIQTNEMLQTISLVITIVGAVLTYLIIPLVTWIKKSKEDGKITKEEIEEGINIISNGIESVENKIDKPHKEDTNNGL